MCGCVGRWVTKKGDGWLSSEVGGFCLRGKEVAKNSAMAGRNQMNKQKTPYFPTGKGERYSQTMPII